MMYKLVRELFDYAPDTGILTRRITTSSRAMKGMKVGCKNRDGYLLVNIKSPDGSRLHYVHRIIWLWMTGEWPLGVIDHIDRNPSNNKLENLRDVSYSTNLHNRHVESGVYWAARDKVWVATMQVNGVRVHIGQSKDRGKAEAMYTAEKIKLLPGGAN